MNSNESELEEQLRALRPRAVNPALEERLAATLDRHEVVLVERAPTSAMLKRPSTEPAPVAHWWQGWGWALAGAAATALVFAFVQGRSERSQLETVGHSTVPAAASGEEFEHTESTEALVTTEDEGLVLSSDE